MTIRQLVATAGVASLALAGSALALGSTTPASAASSAHYLRVASFNLYGVNGDSSAHGDRKVWRKRRPAVVSEILSRHLDVVGLQEANPSRIYRSRLSYGATQYLDLRNAINGRHHRYALTSTASYNCAKSTSSHNCRYRNRHASGDTRILYNTARLAVVKAGAVKYHAQTAGRSARYLAWAIFRVRSTGKRFLFTDTHLDPYRKSVRQAEWSELINHVDALKGSLPVVAVGDFNTSKFDSYAGHYMSAMKNHGYGDVVNQRYNKNTLAHRRAHAMTRAWISSFGGWRRNIASYSYVHDRSHKIGNGIDWVFASNRLTVARWEVVARIRKGTWRAAGVIPSDHHMVAATLVL